MASSPPEEATAPTARNTCGVACIPLGQILSRSIEHANGNQRFRFKNPNEPNCGRPVTGNIKQKSSSLGACELVHLLHHGVELESSITQPLQKQFPTSQLQRVAAGTPLGRPSSLSIFYVLQLTLFAAHFHDC